MSELLQLTGRHILLFTSHRRASRRSRWSCRTATSSRRAPRPRRAPAAAQWRSTSTETQCASCWCGSMLVCNYLCGMCLCAQLDKWQALVLADALRASARKCQHLSALFNPCHAIMQVGGMLAEYCRVSGSCPASTAQELLRLMVASPDLTVSAQYSITVSQKMHSVQCQMWLSMPKRYLMNHLLQVASASFDAFISLLGQQLPGNPLAQPMPGAMSQRARGSVAWQTRFALFADQADSILNKSCQLDKSCFALCSRCSECSRIRRAAAGVPAGVAAGR